MDTDDAQPLLLARDLRKAFQVGDSTLEVLRGVSMEVFPGEFIAIEGRSGSGKSTLLHILGALDAASSGSVIYAGRDIAALSSAERAEVRTREFGFVFQFYHLLPELDVLENAILGPMISHSVLSFRRNRAALRDRGAHLLTELGLGGRLAHRPAQLSGGERQRVAIARALMNAPKVLFADEPTGNLDEETGQQIMQVLERLHREEKQTIVMVTHDRSIAGAADRVLVIHDGRMSERHGR